MTPTTHVLLEGPRGRRLCLEIGLELDPEFRAAAFSSAYELAAGKGISHRPLTSISSGINPAQAPSRTSVRPLSWLAARLRALDLSELRVELMQAALQRSVRNARYWQEPDGEDVLAGAPEITEALSLVAARVFAEPGMRWCWQPRQVLQWAIDWRSADDPAPLPKSPGQTLANWVRNEQAEEIQAARERPGDPAANWSGWWWSAPQGLTKTVGCLPLGLSLVEDSFGWEQATVIPVRGSGRTYEIRTAESWVDLCRRFPLEVTASRRHDWFRVTGRHGRWVIPDWGKVAGEWDAVHLSVLGYVNAAGRALAVGRETATVIAGWNPDSTVWLTDVAREVAGPRHVWRLEPNHDRWVRARDQDLQMGNAGTVEAGAELHMPD